MYQCSHLLEDRIYLISAKSVEGLKIFKRSSEKRKITGVIKQYLEPICDLLHMEICEASFHLVLRLKERDRIKEFYCKKHKGRIKEEFFIPESTYIFGRQMSNLQVSFVKSYNCKFKRKGVLMDGRYRRSIIESEKELEEIIDMVKSGDKRIWDLKKKRVKGKGIWIEKGIKKGGKKDGDRIPENGENKASNDGNNDLRGCFLTPIKDALIPPFLRQKIKFFRAVHPCGPNYN